MQTKDEVRFLKPTAEIWSDALTYLALNSFTPGKLAWVQRGRLISLENGIAVIAVAVAFDKTIIANFNDKLKEALTAVTGVPVHITYAIDESLKPDEYEPVLSSIQVESSMQEPVVKPVPTELPSVVTAPAQAIPTPVENVARPPAPFPHAIERSRHQAPHVQTHPSNTSSVSSIHHNVGEPQALGQAARTGSIPVLGKIPAKPNQDAALFQRANLNGKNTFSTFVIGSNNRFCHSAAAAVSQSPGQSYNPLFIYGGVGLGKTHLMQAIAHEILSRSPNMSVRYISCERFTNDLINSIKDRRMGEFRNRYRHLDVLLVDDIQFIEGKESTQEEFFHTFNALKENGKQIVLSSDRPPKALTQLEDRLRSRFEWGLISDIQAPDFETRLAILRKKCDVDRLTVDDNTLSHIASVFTTNIRELEGALIRVQAYSNMTGERVDQLSLHSLLTPSGTPVQKPSLTVETVIETVAAHYKLEPSELKSSKRSQDLTLPRHVAMYLAHQLMNLSYPRIGAAFGNRKHTSALYAHDRVKELITKDPSVAAAISVISRQLGH